jgi:hypothetical protein
MEFQLISHSISISNLGGSHDVEREVNIYKK